MHNNDIIRTEQSLILKDSWNKGFNCRTVCYGQGYYYAFMEKGFGSWQQFTTNTAFPEDVIKDTWKQKGDGTIISSVNFINNTWAVTMTKLSNSFISQKYLQNNSFPTDDIKTEWNNNYRISDMDYGNGKWIIIMNKICADFNISEQMFNNYPSFPEEIIRSYWSNGYYITVLKYLNNAWYLVMSKYPGGHALQRYNKSPNFPIDDLIKNDHEGLIFSSVTFGSDIWVTVMNGQ